MTTNLNNTALVNNIGPNAREISKYKTERNWAIGIGIIILIASTTIIIVQNNKLKGQDCTKVA